MDRIDNVDDPLLILYEITKNLSLFFLFSEVRKVFQILEFKEF